MNKKNPVSRYPGDILSLLVGSMNPIWLILTYCTFEAGVLLVSKVQILWATENLRAQNKYLYEIFLQYDQFPTRMSWTLRRPPLCAEVACSPCICVGFPLPQAEHIQVSRSLVPIDVSASVAACLRLPREPSLDRLLLLTRNI